MKIRPRSLQQRTFLFILVPTFLLLVGLSIVGYITVGQILLDQWGETAVGRLQRTAHLVDMSLRTPRDLLMLLQGTEGKGVKQQVFAEVLKRIETIDWVVEVDVTWSEGSSRNAMSGMSSAAHEMHRYRMSRFNISLPRYNSKRNSRTVSMESELIDADDSAIGKLEIIVSFDQLIDKVLSAPWWKSNKAYLIDREGNVLASTGLQVELEDQFPMRAFGTVNELEKKTLNAMQSNAYGTVFGPGRPPEEISGYYHLQEAPWTIVIIALGEKALQPIIQFRIFYILSFAVCIVIILFVIRVATNRITRGIKDISAAADDLANGSFGPPLAITTRDEVGELTRSFNQMTVQLKQRLAMQKAISVAREIQQNLLPDASFATEGLTAAGISLYCDETGGDYFDIIDFPENNHKVGVVVGDVVGHGVGAALLMATVRALFRCRIFLQGRLDRIIGDVNTLLYRDTSVSGNFVTMFYLEVDRAQNSISWVRCGHDPAIVYSPGSTEFSELKGEGVALGVDPDWCFEYNEIAIPEKEQLILIGSDGAWEVENENGEQFGRHRLQQILAAESNSHPETILRTMAEAISSFRGTKPQIDDITLTIVKTF